MNAKLAIAIATTTITTSLAQESPVAVPPDPAPTPASQIESPPATPGSPDVTIPGLDTSPPPVPDILTSDNVKLDQTLTRARQLASKDQFAEAGGLLFHAAAALEALSDPTRRDVSEAVASLRILAFDVASHRGSNPAQFRDAAASAHISLATEQVLQARGAWNERRSVATGRALQLASFHVDRSLAWSERATSDGGATTLANANQVGTTLLQSDQLNQISPTEVSASIDRIANMTATVGRSLVSARGKEGLDERITEASRKAIDGIKKGSRKAAEKMGDRLQRWGTAIQNQLEKSPPAQQR